jgi:superfamily II DNA or RNA helicase
VTAFAPGALVTARGREWVVVEDADDDLVVVRSLGGGVDDTTAVVPSLEPITAATFPPPGPDDLGDAAGGALLRTALRTGFRSSGGPFRSLARLAVEPRAYQYVPLLLALRQDPVRLLIADDVGIGKTVESGLIAAELLAQGDVRRLAVLCSPALAEQWAAELHDKFGIDAEVVLPSTAGRLSRGLMMDESLFDRYPFVVVSTDFIKSPNRRAEFLNHCPELVIVDEAHTAVADGAGGGTRARTQRYDLLCAVAADPTRHLVLVTATPHSGKEAGFRNLLGLLDPALATIDLDDVNGRALLARHFVQRRRADIRRYLDQDTAFPSDRESRDAPYHLSSDYAALFDRVLDYARGQVRDASGTGVRQRVRWWSALALLRALASSPVAAAATLRTRASTAGAGSVEEADRLGRATVLDSSDDDAVETIDTAPGALIGPADDGDGGDLNTEDGGMPPDATANPSGERRRLLELARAAEALVGPVKDRKLRLLIDEVKGLLADGYDPIVFCRFIDTADYVAEQLRSALGRAATVAAVTGVLPPALRQERIAELTAHAGRHVLVATDCLSEGVNLQEHFQAVVHYDLAWNPTRHEQREGRVDRFGQTRDIVRAITVYGRDNRVDGIVLDVLIRKFRAIRAATGVSIPVPDDTDNVVEALVEGLILARGRDDADQLSLELGLAEQQEQLHLAWDSAAARERTSRTKYAQETIHPDDVAREVTAARAALGDHGEIAQFTLEALRALGASVTPRPDGWLAVTTSLPIGLRDALPAGHPEPLPLHPDLPAPRSSAVLARTDPTVEAVARYVLDTALDPTVGTRIAARAGVIRTRAVSRRTTVLLVRIRLHLDLPSPTGVQQMLAEEARFVAFAGPPDTPEWLEPDVIEPLLTAQPDGNVAPEAATDLITRIAGSMDGLATHLDDLADRWAAELLDAHRRVRTGAGAPRRGLAVTAQKPVDLLGTYVYLPLAVA